MAKWIGPRRASYFEIKMPKNNQPSEKQQQTNELHNVGAHSHNRAEASRDQRPHQTDHESSRQSFEHKAEVHQQASPEKSSPGIEHDGEIAELAHSLWQARGCPEGSSEEDWFAAAKHLRVRTPITVD